MRISGPRYTLVHLVDGFERLLESGGWYHDTIPHCDESGYSRWFLESIGAVAFLHEKDAMLFKLTFGGK